MNGETATLYHIAGTEIRKCIQAYLELAKATNGLAAVGPEHLTDIRTRTILLAGLGVNKDCSAEAAAEEYKRRAAVHFDLESAIAAGVYRDIRQAGQEFYDVLDKATNGFKNFDAVFISSNPHLLPILQHLAGIFSKAVLKKQIGNVSDNSISGPASKRLAELLRQRVTPESVNRGEILKRLESTLEGIVRDLIGRVLLESIVDAALKEKKLTYQREDEYESIPGVVYDFRADFVLPGAASPLVFIEVRKSSSRHASLYAKDKMFSAINWKGYNQKLLAVLVVDGEWTGETLRVMANVFDYVVPISRIPELVETIQAYLNGDESKLKWLINFRIISANALVEKARGT